MPFPDRVKYTHVLLRNRADHEKSGQGNPIQIRGQRVAILSRVCPRVEKPTIQTDGILFVLQCAD